MTKGRFLLELHQKKNLDLQSYSPKNTLNQPQIANVFRYIAKFILNNVLKFIWWFDMILLYLIPFYYIAKSWLLAADLEFLS